MFEIKVSKEIKDTCPVFAGAAVYAAVKNTAYSEGLWQEINAFTEQLTSTTQMEDILLSLLPVRLINVVAKTPGVTVRQPKLYVAA